MNIAQKILSDSNILSSLKHLMWEAGDVIIDIYNNEKIDITTKKDQSPVTKADLAAHNVLIQGLSKLTPEIPVVSEEDPASLAIPETVSVYWLIDPLDGTKEFINRNGQFTCNLALIESHKPTLGFVGIPVKDELYIGGDGIQSIREKRGSSSTEEQIHCSRISADLTRVVASKSHLNAETEAFINSLEGDVELVQAGSSLKFLKIATGEADIYPRLAPTCEWDTAAAHAVLEGAGGSITQSSGSPMVYGKRDILNPYFIAKGHR
ncbi:3'(2'),5'-bisphosphate nucleotidase CysQ [Neptuniibacter halophilus]|uniref:3'(2'),5'-bisphosphate nucleotidase CysQ n=1 Tax=Neptuniibacter halophilus TaxID=651666 RepID=UPI002573940C|nr:3'(2'),5'-bisphosphate nucleotidase CysQ [Neptuniibacter halophilus]